MTDWLILAIYVIGYFATARHIAIGILDKDAQRAAKFSLRDKSEPLVDTEDKMVALFFGAVAATIWPAVLPFIAIAKGLRAPTEKTEEQRKELEQLRKLAREHGLPMPEDRP
jgi:hypothetical protein